MTPGAEQLLAAAAVLPVTAWSWATRAAAAAARGPAPAGPRLAPPLRHCPRCYRTECVGVHRDGTAWCTCHLGQA